MGIKVVVGSTDIVGVKDTLTDKSHFLPLRELAEEWELQELRELAEVGELQELRELAELREVLSDIWPLFKGIMVYCNGSLNSKCSNKGSESP